jgi:hypothetical protein
MLKVYYIPDHEKYAESGSLLIKRWPDRPRMIFGKLGEGRVFIKDLFSFLFLLLAFSVLVVQSQETVYGGQVLHKKI